MITLPLKGTGFKRKNKVNFFKVFDNLLSKYLIIKINFSHTMAVVGYLPKLK